MNPDKKFRLCAAEIDFLKKDLEITQDILNTANAEFSKEVIRLISLPDSELHSSVFDNKKKQSKEAPAETICDPSTAMDITQKKLFKKIVLETHPDRLKNKSEFEKKYKKNIFTLANNAATENDFYTLVKIAEELEMDLPKITENHVKNLEFNLDKLKKKLIF